MLQPFTNLVLVPSACGIDLAEPVSCRVDDASAPQVSHSQKHSWASLPKGIQRGAMTKHPSKSGPAHTVAQCHRSGSCQEPLMQQLGSREEKCLTWPIYDTKPPDFSGFISML